MKILLFLSVLVFVICSLNGLIKILKSVDILPKKKFYITVTYAIGFLFVVLGSCIRITDYPRFYFYIGHIFSLLGGVFLLFCIFWVEKAKKKKDD